MRPKIRVVAAWIARNGQVLLAQRTSGAHAGFWEFPGGKVELGEDDASALIREMQEELGLRTEIGGLVAQVSWSEPQFDLELVLLEVSQPGTINTHQPVAWVASTDLKLWAPKMPPADRQLLAQLAD